MTTLQTKAEKGLRQVRKTLTIQRPVEELFEVWRSLERLPEFMEHVESVTMMNDSQSHWVVKAPAGTTVEWDAEMVIDAPRMIAWRSLPGSEIRNEGEVIFAPAPEGRGTEVRVVLRYDPPGGVVGAQAAKLWGEEPAVQLSSDLFRFKQLMEVGYIPTVEGQPHGER